MTTAVSSSDTIIFVKPDRAPENLYSRFKDIFDRAATDFLTESREGEDFRLLNIVELALGAAPFTQAHSRIFAEARKANDYSTQWIGWRGYLTIVSIPVAATILSMVPWGSYFPMTTTEMIVTTTCLTTLAVAVSNTLSMRFTGNNPKWESDEKNLDQNACDILHDRFNELSEFIADRYVYGDDSTRELLSWAVKEIDVEVKTQKLSDHSTQQNKVPSIMALFSEAIEFIRSGKIPPRTQLERIIGRRAA